MPTDPPTANPSTVPVPRGQAHPNPSHLAQHQQQVAHQQTLHYPQQHQILQGRPVSHQHQHLPNQQVHYAPLSPARNISAMSPQPQHHPSQPAQPSQQQIQHQQPSRSHQRGPVNQQPPQHQFYGTYNPNMAFQTGQYPPIQGSYAYPYPYGPMPTQPPSQPGPQGGRGLRQSYSPGMRAQPQRQPVSRVSIPAPRKNILAIVDPDTNEEVKVDNVDIKPIAKPVPVVKTPPSQVKIPDRTSRPLELVSDPAETSTAPENSSGKSPDLVREHKSLAPIIHTNTSEFSENKEVSAVHAPLSAVTSSNTPSSSVVEDTSSRDSAPVTVSTPVETVTITHPPVHKDNISTVASRPEETTPNATADSIDPTPSTHIPDANKPSQDKPLAKPLVMNQQSTTSAVSHGPSTTTAAVSAVPASGPKVELPSSKVAHKSAVDGDSSTNGLESNLPPNQATAIPASHSASKETGIVNTSETTISMSSNPDDVELQSTPRRERLVFKEGERRVYDSAYMRSIRSSANPKKSAEFQLELARRNLFKNGPASADPRLGDPRGSRTIGPLAGPLSVDPRGRRAFPAQPSSGYMAPMRGAAPPGMVGNSGVGSYDAFDLRSARSQNPPPTPRGQQGITRDPRISRQGNGRDRFDGPNRHGHGPIDPFVSFTPVEKLKRSENGWKRARESDDEIQTKVKQIRSLLNKLTLEKFNKIFQQIIDINISSYEILTGVVKEVFEKALFEPKFSGMYAELCGRLDVATRDMLKKANIMDSSGKGIYFRNILLNNCREEFIRFAAESEGATKSSIPAEKVDDPSSDAGTETAEEKEKSDEKTLTPQEQKAKIAREKSEADRQATKAKRRMLANVRFISELYLKGLLRETIIHRHCIQKLLQIGVEKKEEDVLEALCKLLSKTGAQLSANKEASEHIDKYFIPLQGLARDHSLPARVRFMLQDLIEQRSNNWKLRREEAGAKTISEIHEDVEKEERAKQEAQAANRDRRGRGGGGMHHRDRNQVNFTRVPMTMATKQRSTGNGMSRSQAMLDKHASRGSLNPSSFQQPMRLGPGGGSRGSGSAPVASLRPGGPGPGGSYFSALPNIEPRDSTVANHSGDVRRAGPKKLPGGPRRSVGPKQIVEEKTAHMDTEKLLRATKFVLNQYWVSIAGITETREYLEEELLPVNYPKFVEEAIKSSVDAKMEQRVKSVSLFCGIIGAPIPPDLFISAFSTVIRMLPDLQMDIPKASEFLAKYIGAIAATRKLADDQSPTFGLDFIKKAVADLSDHKMGAKVVVHVLSELYKNLTAAIPDEKARQAAVKNALDALDIDISAKMCMWNPTNGSSSLEGILREHDIMFVLPSLEVELQLKKVLYSDASADAVLKVFEKLSSEELREEGFMKMVIRVSFHWLFMEPRLSIKDLFSNMIGSPLLQCLKSSIPPNVQMAATLAAQSFIVSNLQVLPAHKEGNLKPGYIVFESLYEADIVEEDIFLKWKEDTGKSISMEGKDKMLMQTTHFFNWLANAEVEE